MKERFHAARFTRVGVWLLVIGYAWLQSSAVRAQNTSPVHKFSTLKEFCDFVALYFPPGTFTKPDGSPDDSRAEVLALYLSDIGEPPLVKSDNNSEAQFCACKWTARGLREYLQKKPLSTEQISYWTTKRTFRLKQSIDFLSV